jgi:hypothetical protein
MRLNFSKNLLQKDFCKRLVLKISILDYAAVKDGN